MDAPEHTHGADAESEVSLEVDSEDHAVGGRNDFDSPEFRGALLRHFQRARNAALGVPVAHQ